MNSILTLAIISSSGMAAIGCANDVSPTPTVTTPDTTRNDSRSDKDQLKYTAAEIEIVAGDLADRKKRIDDAKTLRRLQSFFPELESGKRSSQNNPWLDATIVRFTKKDGAVVDVRTNHDLFEGDRKTSFYFWSEGRGDWELKKPDEFRDFIRELFDEVATSESTPVQRYVAAESAQELKTARHEIVEDLVRRYGKPGGAATHLDPMQGRKFARRADQLMREWNPVGFTVEQLHTLMGEPQRKRDRERSRIDVYSFTIGPVQRHWEFQIDVRDVVAGVEFVPGE